MGTAPNAGPDDAPIEVEPPMDRLEDLYVRYVPAATRLAYFLTGERDQAQDLVQEAFVRIAGRFRHLRDIEDFERYLKRTVVNLYASGLRRRRLERAWLERERQRPQMPSLAEDPVERDAMWVALRRLPERQRVALVLRFYEDLSEQDTAHLLHTSVSAVNALVARALRALRDDLDRSER